MTKVKFNGLGRITGNTIFQMVKQGVFFTDGGIEIVGVNDLRDNKTLALDLRNDSCRGQFPLEVGYNDSGILVGGKLIPTTHEPDPAKLSHNGEIIGECTGRFTKREDLEKHLNAGASNVLLSVTGATDVTLVRGVNHLTYDPKTHRIVSNATCTTNALAVGSKVLVDDDGIEIKTGNGLTVHSGTNDENVCDGPHKDPRRARGALENLIGTSTGAAKGIGKVIPELDGKMRIKSVRVPTLTGSVIYYYYTVKADSLTAPEINALYRAAADGPLKGILEYKGHELDEVVLKDIIGNPHTCIFDPKETEVTDLGNGEWEIAVVFWYDNEMGYSAKMVNQLQMIGAGMK